MQSAASAEYLTAADASIRQPIGKLEITWSDAQIEPITSVVATTSNRGSQDDQIADTKTNPNYKYTLLDGTWALNEDYHLAPETAIEVAAYQIGYYGNLVSASSAPYTFSAPEVVTVNFSARTIQGVYIAGDKLLNEYPVDYQIDIYAGAALLFSIVETSNNQVEKYYSGQYLNVTKLVLTINEWSAPDTCCKIVELFTSFVSTYFGDDIINMKLLEEREIRDATLPIGNISANDLDFTIQNYEYGLGEWVQPNQVMVVKSDVQNVTEWAVYQIVNNGTPSLVGGFTCPSSDLTGTDVWYFVYYYTIPGSLITNDTIQLYFEPTGADTGKPGAFYSDIWEINTIIYEPYNPDNPDSFFINFLKPNRKIKAYLGFILDNGAYEYLPIGTFWNNDWRVDDNRLSLSTDCRDRLGVLKDSIYDGSTLLESNSLFTIATTVLNYAKAYIPMNDLQWDIDVTLSSIIIPYAFFDRVSYFEILKAITEACLGQCYMTKDDVLVIESYDKNLNIDAPGIYLTKDSYFNISQKFSFREILNKIDINYFMYQLESSAAFYTSDSISIGASATLEPITINYTNPVRTGAVAALNVLTGTPTLNKVSEAYYSWGYVVTVEETAGNAGTFEIEITGQELTLAVKNTASVEDTNSITEFSEMAYSFPDNNLIQDETTALLIGNALIDTYADPRSDITVDYPGNPAVELSDTMRVTVFKRSPHDILKDFIIYKSELNFNGTLSGKLYGKLQTYTGVLGDELQDSDNALSTMIYQDTDGASTEWQDTDT